MLNAEIMTLTSESRSDESDRAAALQLMSDIEGRQKHIAKMRPRLSDEFDGESCVSCGDVINPGRIKAMRYSVPKEENLNPHCTDEIAGGAIVKHGTDLCIACAEIKYAKSLQYN